MKVPGTKWYLKAAKLRPEVERRWGYETEIVEYCTYHWLLLGSFTIYLNDWSNDS